MSTTPQSPGALVFEPSNLTISKGESVTFTNNAGFPHNVVFDEDAVPVRALLHPAPLLRLMVMMMAVARLRCQLRRSPGQARPSCLPARGRGGPAMRRRATPPLAPMRAQAGVNAEALSHEDYLNAPGESFTIKLDTAGEYGYYCEPHQGAGMAGKITVN
jgi:plastocyanin